MDAGKWIVENLPNVTPASLEAFKATAVAVYEAQLCTHHICGNRFEEGTLEERMAWCFG
jgi:hypothetical protein